MIHPLDWSLRSIYKRLKYGRYPPVMDDNEKYFYIHYLQPRGKIVLDLGAYTGDSARLFLDAGAKKVICIEKDQMRAAQIHLPNTVVYAEGFDPDKHLALEWDVMKMDIEGYEGLLLPYLNEIKKPMIVESHNWWLNEEFEKAGFIYLVQPTQYMCGVSLMGRDGNG